MLAPNHIYIDGKKVFIENLTNAKFVKFNINDLNLKIENDGSNIIIKLFNNENELQGIINYEQD